MFLPRELYLEVGGFDENTRGRSLASKQLVVLALEKVVNKKGKITIGRAYAKVIQDASILLLGNAPSYILSSNILEKEALDINKIAPNISFNSCEESEVACCCTLFSRQPY